MKPANTKNGPKASGCDQDRPWIITKARPQSAPLTDEMSTMNGKAIQPSTGGQGGEQLEVAPRHAVLARQELINVVKPAEQQICGGGADDGIGRAGSKQLGKQRVQQQAQPEQRQG